MKKYIKKPVAIEAIKLLPSQKSIREVMKFTGIKVETSCNASRDAFETYCDTRKREGGIIIKTLEGEHVASFGDFIIKGVKGEFYPCKPDIFKQTYYTEEEYANL